MIVEIALGIILAYVLIAILISIFALLGNKILSLLKISIVVSLLVALPLIFYSELLFFIKVLLFSAPVVLFSLLIISFSGIFLIDIFGIKAGSNEKNFINLIKNKRWNDLTEYMQSPAVIAIGLLHIIILTIFFIIMDANNMQTLSILLSILSIYVLSFIAINFYKFYKK